MQKTLRINLTEEFENINNTIWFSLVDKDKLPELSGSSFLTMPIKRSLFSKVLLRLVCLKQRRRFEYPAPYLFFGHCKMAVC